MTLRFVFFEVFEAIRIAQPERQFAALFIGQQNAERDGTLAGTGHFEQRPARAPMVCPKPTLCPKPMLCPNRDNNRRHKLLSLYVTRRAAPTQYYPRALVLKPQC